MSESQHVAVESDCGAYIADLEGEVVQCVALPGMFAVSMRLLRWA